MTRSGQKLIALISVVLLTLVFGRLWFVADECSHAQNCRGYRNPGYSSPHQEHEESLWDRTTNDPIALYTFLLAIFTLALASASVWQGYFLIRADRTAKTAADAALRSAKAIATQNTHIENSIAEAKRAADEMTNLAKATDEANKISRENTVAIRRAWLSIEDVKAQSPTQTTDHGGLLSIVAKVRNLGATPAFAIRFEATGLWENRQSPDYNAGYEAFKSRLSNHPPAGIIIFPNEFLIEGATWSFTGEQVKQFLASRPPDWGTLSFVIFVGASYQIVGSQQRHLTIFEYSLHMPINSAIPLDRPQELRRNPFISGEVD